MVMLREIFCKSIPYPDQTAHQTALAKLSGKGMMNMPKNDLRINIFMCANSKTNSMNHFDIHGTGQGQTKKSDPENKKPIFYLCISCNTQLIEMIQISGHMHIEVNLEI